jgi:S-DNA-T family DNA segregation ATPase FtsK/SpoIIIE
MDQNQSLNEFFKSHKIDAEVIESTNCDPYRKFWVRLGPTGTVKKIENKAREIGLALRASAPICTDHYQRGALCLEMMDGENPPVSFEELATSTGFTEPNYILGKHELPVLLGAVDASIPLVIDLHELPHLLIAGTTGSGKSVSMHCVIKSLAMHAQKNRIKVVLIDPKHVEFNCYDNISCRRFDCVAVDPDVVTSQIDDLIDEMEKRLRILKKYGCRDLREYRKKTCKGSYIVVVIDELSDLMLMTKRRFETSLTRLAQKARAAGIHIVAATQYPHSSVITKTITANFLGRICFQVASATESRVVLGDKNGGAVHLQGKGDGYLIGCGHYMQRFQGAMISTF